MSDMALHKVGGNKINRLIHNKAGKSRVSSSIPTVDNLQEGQETYVVVNGKLRLYKKVGGILYYFSST